MDNDSLLSKENENHTENNVVGVVEDINQKIDDIQILLNNKQEKDIGKQKEIIAWVNEIKEIINAPVSEDEILKNLEKIYKNIQEENKNEKTATETNGGLKQNIKEIPIHPKTKQDAVDIIHTSERGIPMFVSNNMKKTAVNLGISIGEKDKPDEIIEKMKGRLKNTQKQENVSLLIIPEKKSEEENLIIKDEKGIHRKNIGESTQKDDEERVHELKKQIETLLNPKTEELPTEQINRRETTSEVLIMETKKVNNTPQKTRTVSDLLLAQLG